MSGWLRSLGPLLPALAALAEAEPGQEVCGFVLEAPGGAIALRPARNVAPDPRRRFEVDARDLLAVHRLARGGGPAVVAVYHSHPVGGAGLSAADRAALLLEDGAPLLPGVDLVVVGLRQGRADEVRVHRYEAPGRLAEVARAGPERTKGEVKAWVISAKPS